MGFLLDGLDTEGYDRTYGDSVLLRRILRYFRPKLASMVLVAVMIVLHSATQAAVPLLVSRGVDRIEAGTVASVGWQLTGAILAAGVLGWGFSFIRQWYSARVT